MRTYKYDRSLVETMGANPDIGPQKKLTGVHCQLFCFADGPVPLHESNVPEKPCPRDSVILMAFQLHHTTLHLSRLWEPLF